MRHFSIGFQVLAAVILGIATGLFFGPLTSILSPIGSAYTMLFQMAVLPYIAFSIAHGLGAMTPTTGKKIFKSGWLYFLCLWLFIFFWIFLLSTLIPRTLTPLIVTKTSMEIETDFTNHFLSNLIPENPFYDIFNNVAPAVAMFGLITGLALMHVEKKEPLIGVLERINQLIEKILYWLGVISPIGAFVYIAIAFGTIHFEDLFKMQLYVFAFIASTLWITFWLLPSLLATLTPLSFEESSKAVRSVCLVPFVTGLSTTAIPFINTYLKQLSQKHETHEKFRETSQTVLPIAYCFGHIGNAMILFFILFLSYYYRHPFTLFEQTLLFLMTIPLSLGSTTGNLNAILFLIKHLGFPVDASTLFLEIKSFTNNFQVLMSIASVFTLLILTIYSYYGLIRIQWKRGLSRLAAPLMGIIVLILAIHPLIHPKDLYENLYLKLKLSEAINKPVKATVLQEADTGVARSYSDPNMPQVLEQILGSHVLKIGFNAECIPYSYFNEQHELVGYDIAYAYELARDLNCELQFIPLKFSELAPELLNGDFDIGMSAIIMNEPRLVQMQFAFPYAEDTNVLVVKRDQRKRFLNLASLQALPGVRIGVGGIQSNIAKELFPVAEVVYANTLEQIEAGGLDALLWTKTTALIWCFSHPEYVVIDYGGQIGKSYYSYPFRPHAIDFGFFFNNWLILKSQSGFKKDMENYWIHGISLKPREPRWSILRNVFHWRD
ncbi:MAG: cation:dicarboxylase symporter family transporter [Verrucomicrobia bacterium]|nr:cation:dicarboxylase symporter family transporter [Verrucomicrobiota bacterium]